MNDHVSENPRVSEQPTQQIPDIQHYLQSKRCVLHSLASVASNFAHRPIHPDENIIALRTQDMASVLHAANLDFQQAIQGWQNTGREPSIADILQLTQDINERSSSEDRVNVEKLIHLVQTDPANSSLSEALKGTRAEYKTAFSYGDVVRELQKPNQQVCIVFPEHMAHVQLENPNVSIQDAKILSLSDNDTDQAAAEFNNLIVHQFLLRNDTTRSFNLIVFTQAEQIRDEAIDSMDQHFLDFSITDPDYQRAVETVVNLKAQSYERPNFHDINDSVYPTVTVFDQRNSGHLGPFTAQEAVAMGYIARKAAVLKQSFGFSFDKSREIVRLYTNKAVQLNLPAEEIPDTYWPDDVADGMIQFVNNLPASENEMTPYDLANLIQNEIHRGNPGGARNDKEIQDRINSRKVGAAIARDLYSQTLIAATQAIQH